MTSQETLLGSNNPPRPEDPYERTSGVNLPLDPRYWTNEHIEQAAGRQGENSFEGYTSEHYQQYYEEVRRKAIDSSS